MAVAAENDDVVMFVEWAEVVHLELVVTGPGAASLAAVVGALKGSAAPVAVLPSAQPATQGCRLFHGRSRSRAWRWQRPRRMARFGQPGSLQTVAMRGRMLRV